MTPAEWLDLLEERGPRLRAAGVRSIHLEGVSVRFAPPDPPAAPHPPAARPQGALNALDDPSTFGGMLPGWKLPVQSDEES